MKLAAGPVAEHAAIEVAVADPALASAIAASLTAALAAIEVPPLAHAVVYVRSRKRIAARAAELAGAIAMVGITPRNARHLVEILDRLRAADVAGIQLVCDGPVPERHVFAALERARSQPAAAPVVLAATLEPTPALLLLVAHRLRRTS